jgi:hypothetical protein
MIRNFFELQKRRLTQWRNAIAQLHEVYIEIHNRAPAIFRPRRFTEKMQWRKLFDANPIYPVLCDKLAVRDFIAARIGDQYHVPVLWIGAPADIPFETTPPPYVIKSNHACGQVMMITDRTSIDAPAMRKKAASWLTQPYGVRQEEAAYWSVPPLLFIEQMLQKDNGAPPDEIRVFTFHGKAVFIQTTVIENGVARHGRFHTPQWSPRDWYFTQARNHAYPKPERLDEMIRIAEILSRDFDHLRVDFFDDGNRLWASELTLFSWSGFGVFHPDEADFEMGNHWRLRAPMLRALAAILLRRRPIPWTT